MTSSKLRGISLVAKHNYVLNLGRNSRMKRKVDKNNKNLGYILHSNQLDMGLWERKMLV